MLAPLWQDLRHGSRFLLARPGFTAVAVLTLAVGIGANTAVFSLINEVFLRQPPGVAAPQRLALLGRTGDGSTFEGFSLEGYLAYRERTRAFAELAAYRTADLNLSARVGAERVKAELVTSNYFSVLGVRPALGRAFLPEENLVPGSHPVAILSQRLWRERFADASDPAGKTVRLNGATFTVVGIAPTGFEGVELDDPTDVWLPLMMEGVARPVFPVVGSRLFSALRVIGRLTAGATVDTAQAEAAVLGRALQALEPHEPAPRRIVLSTDLRFPDPEFRREVREFLALLAAVVGLVLLIACANIAGLLLARASTRRREMALRLVLGATRRRVLGQLLTESLLLALAGGAAGVAVARGLTELLLRLLSVSELGFRLDGGVLGFTALVSLLTVLLFGLAPALQAVRQDLVPALKEGTAGSTGTASRLRALLVTFQVAISLVLLVGTTLLARTLANLQSIHVGYDAGRVLAAPIELRPLGYDETRARALQKTLGERVASLPGVSHTSLANQLPWRGFLSGTIQALPAGQEPSATGRGIALDYQVVGASYFATLGIPVLRGREFTERDRGREPSVAIVSAAMARSFWPGEDPIVKRLRVLRFLGWSGYLEVVGVAADVRYDRLEPLPKPHLYMPLGQDFEADTVLLVRTTGDPGSLRAAVAAVIRELDPDLALPNVATVAERLRDLDAEQRTTATLVGLCGAFALVVSVVGLYGLVSYTVNQRTRELGIRMALGAGRGDVARWALMQGVAPSLAGVAAGILIWFIVSPWLVSRLYGIRASDPATLALAALLLPLVALAASLMPARRAMRVDPAATLRAE